jgi:pSer/pThr/pTyr-binding forkhead associated (FHA) protein
MLASHDQAHGAAARYSLTVGSFAGTLTPASYQAGAVGWAPMPRKLTLQHNATTITFDQDEVWIGRSPAADLHIRDTSVSLAHARIRRVGGEWLIWPSGEAKNGTRRRGEWVPPETWTLLASGDVLVLGEAAVGVTIRGAVELGARLITLGGLSTLEVWHLVTKPGGLTIGRAEGSDVLLRGSLASRQHARLTLLDGSWWIADAGGSTGTLVNGARITDRRLGHGDELGIGAERLLFIHHERSDLAFSETDEQPQDQVPGGDDTTSLDVMLGGDETAPQHAPPRGDETAPQPSLNERDTMLLGKK